ncbi:membrane protein [Cronobacter phage CR9]|uniref:Uncharacterized protein n=1 Tax=Cronobacter phage CR9 TaxID=1162290 RepID=M1F1F8_9CAUD|nr:membrane protein [Cronobacter phage CR9]AFH21147.1 hypothetical protein CR9_263 [Cronobacter phage CR9]
MTVDPVLVILGVVIIILCGYWADDKFLKPKRMTTPPVDKILNLIAEEKTFKVYSGAHMAPKEVSDKMFIDWTLQDTVTGEYTWFYNFPMCGSVAVEGDLSWVNSYEAKRLYFYVSAIGSRQNAEEEKQRDLKYQQLCDHRRDVAKKVYESR